MKKKNQRQNFLEKIPFQITLKPVFTILVLLLAIFFAGSLFASDYQLHWQENFPLNPTITYLGETYTLNSIEGDGIKLLQKLYTGKAELEQILQEAIFKGRLLSIYSVSSMCLLGIDLITIAAGNPVTWTWTYTGAMFKLFEGFVFPVNHLTLLKESVAKYNQTLAL